MANLTTQENIPELCRLAECITGIGYTVLDTPEAIRHFSTEHYHDPVQKFLVYSALETLIEAMHPYDLVCLTDPFHISFHFLKLKGITVAVGPYCPDSIGRSEAAILLRQLEINPEGDEKVIRSFLAFRSQFPQAEQKQVMKHIYGLIRFIEPGAHYEPRQIGYEERAYIIRASRPNDGKSYSDVIRRRYGLEDSLRTAIASGNYQAARNALTKLQDDVSYLLAIGNRTQNQKTALLIQGTTIRIYASAAGLSPVLVDSITNAHFEEQLSADTLAKQEKAIDGLLRDVCREVTKYRSGKYSALTQSVWYQLESHSEEDISLPALAKNLGVSESYMITCFREETGQTPNAFLTEVRLQKAARMLLHTSDSVTDISMAVGITDANYFTKLFRKRWGQTPLQYRRNPLPQDDRS